MGDAFCVEVLCKLCSLPGKEDKRIQSSARKKVQNIFGIFEESELKGDSNSDI